MLSTLMGDMEISLSSDSSEVAELELLDMMDGLDAMLGRLEKRDVSLDLRNKSLLGEARPSISNNVEDRGGAMGRRDGF